MKTHIAYMTGEYPRATDTFIQREIAALRDLGVSIDTFSIRKPAMKENVGPEQQRERENTFYVLPATLVTVLATHLGLILQSPIRWMRALGLAIKTSPPGLRAMGMQLAYFAEAGMIAREMNRRSVGHLHNHFSNSSCSVAMLAAELGGFTFSFTMHGPAEFFEPQRWRIDEKIARAKFVACISNFARSQAMIFAKQEHWQKLHIVHCGVNPAEYHALLRPEMLRSAQHDGGSGESVTANPAGRLLFVGRLAAVKGLPVLLDAFAKVLKKFPAATLTLAGDGPDRDTLIEQARHLGILHHVFFIGYQSQSQVRDLLRETDVFVMASFAEGVPVVLMEAMAAGVPVIATRVAGVSELVEDEKSGLLVPPSDVESLASAMERIIGDAALRTKFAKAGRNKVDAEFDIAQEARKLHQLLTTSPPLPRTRGGGQGWGLDERGASGSPHPNPPPEYRERGQARADARKYLLITPCRDEAKYARRTLDSITAQTVPPALWLIVDDGSTDETPAILAEYAKKLPYLRILRRDDRGFRKLGGGVIDAFYHGYDTLNPSDFDFVCKLDLDLDLPPNYFETLMERMNENPRIGTCSGKPYFRDDSGRLISEKCGDENSVGMVKFYRTECFQQIGGFVRELMWDGIDCHRCRMLGWSAVSWDDPELRFEHLRPMGTSHKNWWTGRVRHGIGQYYMGTGPIYMLASAVFRMTRPPIVIGGLAMLWGYLKSWISGKERYPDPAFRKFLRKYQWNCLLRGKSRATHDLDARQEQVWQAQPHVR